VRRQVERGVETAAAINTEGMSAERSYWRKLTVSDSGIIFPLATRTPGDSQSISTPYVNTAFLMLFTNVAVLLRVLTACEK